MRLIVLVLGFLAVSATSAAAQSYNRCGGYQRAMIEAVLPGAHEMALAASVAVGDTPEYRQWFGAFNSRHAEQVRANLKAVYKALDEETMRFFCGTSREPGCQEGTYAFVYASEAYTMTLCPLFFDLPTMYGGQPGDARFEFGTMEGTIIHEVSHFEAVADTEDHCYGRGPCMDMARRDAYSAVTNADTYQYFSEDIGFAAGLAADRQ